MLMCMLLTCLDCYAQVKSKKDVYIMFRQDSSNGTHKEHVLLRPDNHLPEEKYEIYWYKVKSKKSGRDQTFAYVPIAMKKYIIKNEDFLKRSVSSIDELQMIDAFGYDSRDQKRFPYQRVFIVDYLSPDHYKVIQVNTYLGSYF